ncbi:MAG TPA: exodeoxyribonuclease VII small subunit [Chitinophagales bacterium]|nr:exodeoxyribonuclease VII small subunit [Chitinophagales bacterium]
MNDKQQSYSEAIAELETITEEMESSEIDVDQLAKKAKRAAELIKFCKAQLSQAETEVNSVLAEMKSDA